MFRKAFLITICLVVGVLAAIFLVVGMLNATCSGSDEFGCGGLAKNLESSAGAKLPKFITASHIKISDISHVSKFRSSAGHDFSDSFEECCSMKHYFIPIDEYGARFTQPIYSPVDGVVLYLEPPFGFGGNDDWKINYQKERVGRSHPLIIATGIYIFVQTVRQMYGSHICMLTHLMK